MRKILKKILILILLLTSLSFIYFFIGAAPAAEKITWGVNFSQKHAEGLDLDWQEVYLAILNDLGVKNLKIATHWDLIEPGEGEYDFKDLDWQISTAEEKGAKILLVIGMKTPRWPECHIPDWAKNLSKEEQQKEILELLEKTVLRYRDRASVWAWQVENEPLFAFGDCPWIDEKFLKKEIELVKNLDKGRTPVIISDSGEQSFWFRAAKLSDIVGTTMYREVWVSEQKTLFHYPLPPVFYWRRAEIIEKLFQKKVIVVELQAEPWGESLLYDLPLEKQKKLMNLKQFQNNIEYAKKTGLDEFYLWGPEWWYWLKEKQNEPEIWNEAEELFNL